MKRILFYNLLFVTAFLLGCNKKDLPDPVDGTPVFTADLDFGNGNIKSWEAGVDSFYMFTSFEKDSLDVLNFIGKMEREACGTDCRETLEIIIRDIGQTFTSLPNIEEALSKDVYLYKVKNATDTQYIVETVSIFEVNFHIDTTVVPVNSFTTYEWFENGIFAGETADFKRIYDFAIPSTDIMLKVTNTAFGDSCVVWQTQHIQQLPSDRCAVRIKPIYNIDFFLEDLVAIPSTQSPNYSLNWSNGFSGNSFGGQIEPLVPYAVTLTDNQNDCLSEAGFIWSGLTVDTISSCSAHFNYEVLDSVVFIDSTAIIVPGDPLQFSAVTVIYVDELGNTFRSDRFRQDSNTKFTIQNREDYDDNENGQATKKLGLQFNCTLWDENGNKLTIKDGKATWGIAYPN